MIFIDNRQEIINVEDKLLDKIKEIIDYGLKEEGVKVDYEVSVILIDNKEIRNINRENRNVDSVTDVLSFPMLEYPEGKVFKDVYSDYEFDDTYLDDEKLVIGDIAISLERAKEQSIEYGHSFLREVLYLTVHSVLHLMGYDHMEEIDKEKMRAREEEILNRFGISR
ncbi:MULTISPECIES: rRNA maturation RNase YbeY [Clostridium]|uniref:rRNA maturation RNase YbeY n=1 Tax=Clostridium TaxID=1485 RepID=UPI00069FB8A4|nr:MULTISPECIES: rRNA maturation RNase YbeY [Clostridium]KOF57018.1 heat-shock protein [Clostridium sp. DMHC 10]MCD2347516.1 rRNA maturation RNase YbeY [Clostridium guangxiense]